MTDQCKANTKRGKRCVRKAGRRGYCKTHEHLADAELEREVEQIVQTPQEDWSLARRIVWVRERVKRLGKDTQVGSGGYGYRGLSHDKVTAFIRPKLNDAGILVVMTCREWNLVETGTVTKNGRKITQFQATYDVTFSNMHNSQEMITVQQVAFADDQGDKGPGKAASYAIKYALLKMFMIETGEDDEDRDVDTGERGQTIADDQKAQADVYAVADELYGEDADKKLEAMAKRRFMVDAYTDIPIDRLDDVFRALRSNYQREQREKESKS